MMNEKRFQVAKSSIEMKIEWEQKNIERCMKQIKDTAERGDVYSMATFLPGYCKELQEAVERQKAYVEQLDMLRFIGEE